MLKGKFRLFFIFKKEGDFILRIYDEIFIASQGKQGIFFTRLAHILIFLISAFRNMK